jgi:dTDP-3-amino-3,4,6-trideoxy-alpha-D-glucose transaminase
MEFNDVRLQYETLKADIDAALGEVLSGGRYILGPAMQSFEQEFSRYCGAAEGVAVASGTDALSIGLMALGIGKGDDVFVPAISAPATAVAVVLAGATPVFVDVSREDFMLDPADAAKKRTDRCRAVIPVHLYGMPARLDELSGLGLPVLEDAAQAHGSDGKWGRCGAFGEAAAFSFYPTKNLGAYGDAGMLVTSNSAIAEKARLLRNYGQRENYSAEISGQNSRLDEIHAAILRIKLRRLDEWNGRRRQIASLYREAFRSLPVQLQKENGVSNHHLFVICTDKRENLRAHLASRAIPSLIHYPIPLPRQKAFAQFNPAQCPNADWVCGAVLSLPIHAHMSDSDVEQVVEGVRQFFK